MNEVLATAIRHIGGQTALARKLSEVCGREVSQGNVWCWLRRNKKVPAEFCAHIEKATEGRVRREELRPDVFGGAP